MSIAKKDQGLDWKRKPQVKQTMSNYDEMMMRAESKAEQMSLFTDDRNFFEKLCSLEYLREGRWALSITRASHLAYSNKWFIQEMSQKIKSTEKYLHWFGLNQWIKIT